jgi:hypothetical protein
MKWYQVRLCHLTLNPSPALYITKTSHYPVSHTRELKLRRPFSISLSGRELAYPGFLKLIRESGNHLRLKQGEGEYQMKTDYQCSGFYPMRRRPERKRRTIEPQSRKSEGFVYPSLNEFLSQYPVSTVNEYGERVISGRRIC